MTSSTTRVLLAAIGVLFHSPMFPAERILAPSANVSEAQARVSKPQIRWVREVFKTAEGSLGRRLLRRIAGKSTEQMFLRPYGVAFTNEGTLITDPSAQQVVLWSPSGKVSKSPPGLFESPIGVAECTGAILVTDSRKGAVAVLDPQLELRQWLLTDLERPTGVACSGDRILIAETGAHRIVVLDGQGHRSTIGRRGNGPAEFNFPSALAVSGSDLWVADTLNFRIQRLDLETGTYKSDFGQIGDLPGQTPRIKGLAIDAAGHMWISDGVLDSVTLFSQSGDFLLDLAQEVPDHSDFSFPAGIAANDDGDVVVVDSLNRRLQVYSIVVNNQLK